MRLVRIIFSVFLAVSFSSCASQSYNILQPFSQKEPTTQFSDLMGLQSEVYIEASPEEVFRFMQNTEKVKKAIPHMNISLEPGDARILEKPGDTYHVKFYFWTGEVPGLFVLTKFEEPTKLQGFILSETWMRLEIELFPEGSGTIMRQRTIIEVPKGLATLTRVEMWMVSLRNRRFASYLGEMMNTKVRYKPSGQKLFTIICNIHRATSVIDSPPNKVWQNLTQVEFLNQAMAPFASLKTGSQSLNKRGDLATISPRKSSGEISIKAVVVNIEPEKEAHLSIFIDEINAGAIFRLRPYDGKTEAECIFYYEIPSDYLMSSEQMLILSGVDANLRSFLNNLK